MVERTDDSWPECEREGCIGIQLAASPTCLAHASEAELEGALRIISESGVVDARGVPLSAKLLDRVLAASPRADTGKAVLKAARFDRATFTGDAGFGETTFSDDAQFNGATFTGAALFDRATFTGDAQFDRVTFSDTALFIEATFSGDAQFDRVTFTGTAWFDRATFTRAAQFNGTTFSGDAWFEQVTFTGDAQFNGTTFTGTAWFDRVTFTGTAQFNGTTFSCDTRFDRATFTGGASFSRAAFTTVASFSRVAVTGAMFEEATFTGIAWFDWVTFTGAAWFDRATFSDDVWFDRATFTGTALFIETTLSGDAQFDRVSFTGTAWFDRATFTRAALFNGATFSGDARFERVTFTGTAQFNETTFSGDARFRGATFHRLAEFERTRFEQSREFGPLLAYRGLVLDDALFAQQVQIEVSATGVCCRRARFPAGAQFLLRWARVVFDDADFPAPSILSGVPPSADEVLAAREERIARAWRRLLGERISEQPQLISLRRANVTGLALSNVAVTDCRFGGAHNLDILRLEANIVFPSAPAPLGRLSWEGRQVIAEEREWRANRRRRWGWRAPWWPGWADQRPTSLDAGQIAALYRALRKGREDTKDEPGAADFYYGEMEMRRHARPSHSTNTGSHIRNPSRGRAERGILAAYWLVSGYGLRAWRAIAWLAALTALMAFAFHTVGFAQPPHPVSYWTSLLYAFRATLSLTDSEVMLTAWGQLLQGVLRLTGPVLLGLALLALRGRVRR
jgi:Pentapeptide repeats (9 copies)